MKYKIISAEIIKNLIEFLDEVQFDAAKESSAEEMQKVNFCTWAINELLNSYNVVTTKDFRKSKDDPKKPKKKSRDNYIDETFMDWNLPEMTDKEFEKLVDTFDNFLRAWEKEYLKDNSDKEIKKTDDDEWKPRIEDVAQHCSLEEIEDMLKDDPELTPEERFDLYYEEHERVNYKKDKTYTLDELYKKIKINRPPRDERN